MFSRCRDFSSISFAIFFIVLLLGMSYMVLALPPPPPPLPFDPSFGYNDTNTSSNTTINTTVNTTINTTINASVNTTVNTTINTTINATINTTVNVTVNNTVNNVTNTTNTTNTTSITPAITGSNTTTSNITNSSVTSPTTPNTVNLLGNNEYPAVPSGNDTGSASLLPPDQVSSSGSGNDQGPGTEQTSSIPTGPGNTDSDIGSEQDGSTKSPLTDSPTTVTTFDDLKEEFLEKLSGTLGIASAIVTMVLLLLFVVLNKDPKPRINNNLFVKPVISLPQEIQQMPVNYMPPRIGPQSQHLQALQLKYKEELVKKRRLMKYQLYLNKIHRMHMLEAQRQQSMMQGQQGINPQYPQNQQSAGQQPISPNTSVGQGYQGQRLQ